MVLRLYVQECVTVDLFKSICTFMTTYPSTPSESSEEVFKFNLNSRVHLSVLTLSSTLAGGLNGAILAIQEKHGIWSQGEWKRPTGVIKQIDPEFVQVIGFSGFHCLNSKIRSTSRRENNEEDAGYVHCNYELISAQRLQKTRRSSMHRQAPSVLQRQ
uniref:Uncharacterized protein n=1 Tax=Physcomitrium patens TaxID=3218 RepID=A0A7I4EDR4_PHYPA|nr:uncharacterized protein LOC112284517 isoform X3 [Physcomitrium patens]|eukprot:XP_024380160.1 uncharacterized protein LOC112284517 isoform X3 [Physcomitrella patens]